MQHMSNLISVEQTSKATNDHWGDVCDYLTSPQQEKIYHQ